VTTLPRRVSYLSRVLFRTRGSALPRGMRSVVFTLAFGPMRISEIAWEEGIGQPAATRMVARLEALGLVVRERSELDRRIVMVRLTDSGRLELDNLREQSRRLLREALRDRSAAELRRMRTASDALGRLTDWVLEQERELYGSVRRAAGNGSAASAAANGRSGRAGAARPGRAGAAGPGRARAGRPGRAGAGRPDGAVAGRPDRDGAGTPDLVASRSNGAAGRRPAARRAPAVGGQPPRRRTRRALPS